VEGGAEPWCQPKGCFGLATESSAYDGAPDGLSHQCTELPDGKQHNFTLLVGREGHLRPCTAGARPWRPCLAGSAG
jgi:hypothetical protein